MARCPAALLVCVAIALPASLVAKGDTTRITISGADLRSPIDITDPVILHQFNVWSGPGTFQSIGGRDRGVEATEGFIIDWSSGAVEPPGGLQRYEVAFHNAASARPVYVVFYEPDASGDRGFVYLPGAGDEWYRLNAGTIIRGHGFEGHWFRASRAWQQAAAHLMARGW